MIQRHSNEGDCSWEGAVRSMSNVVLHRKSQRIRARTVGFLSPRCKFA